MIKQCRDCKIEFSGNGKWCPSCTAKINAEWEAANAPEKKIAKELGLVDTGFGSFAFPAGMGPVGFDNYFGVIGFRAINPEPNTKWPGFYYSVITWDCPTGGTSEYPLMGLTQWIPIELKQ